MRSGVYLRLWSYKNRHHNIYGCKSDCWSCMSSPCRISDTPCMIFGECYLQQERTKDIKQWPQYPRQTIPGLNQSGLWMASQHPLPKSTNTEIAGKPSAWLVCLWSLTTQICAFASSLPLLEGEKNMALVSPKEKKNLSGCFHPALHLLPASSISTLCAQSTLYCGLGQRCPSFPRLWPTPQLTGVDP